LADDHRKEGVQKLILQLAGDDRLILDMPLPALDAWKHWCMALIELGRKEEAEKVAREARKNGINIVIQDN
jgi:hypothetical protein